MLAAAPVARLREGSFAGHRLKLDAGAADLAGMRPARTPGTAAPTDAPPAGTRRARAAGDGSR